MTQNVFIDFETDGLNTNTCTVLQYAVIDEHGRVMVARTCGFEPGLWQPEAESLTAINYNGYDLATCGPLYLFSANDLVLIENAIEGKKVWAHNAEFDRLVLERQCKRYGRSIQSLQDPWGCTMELACKTFGFPGQTRMKLPMLMQDSVAHDAVDDAKNCWLLWQKCNGLGRYDTSLEPKTLEF